MSDDARVRLAVDCRRLVPGQIGGLEGQFRDTFDVLLREHGRAFDVTLLTTGYCDDSFGSWDGAVRRTRAGERDGTLAPEQLSEFDVLYAPFLLCGAEWQTLPLVVNVPDLQHVQHPELFDARALEERIRCLRPAVGYAARVVTISECTMRHVVASFHVPDHHVVIAPLDAHPRFRRPRDTDRIARVASALDLPARYVVFPANAWPHKNHRGLFAALARYRERWGDPPHAVLCGARSVGGVDLRAEARAARVEDLVRHVGFVDAGDLPELYDGAVALVFPSLFEGFGIPVVEAMRRGTPVITADRTSLPEVVGPHGVLVDPEDPDALAAAIRGVVSDPAAATQRAAAAREWAERFSYAETAARLREALERAARERPDYRPRSRCARDARPKVFAVTPSRDQGEFLAETVESVLAQDWDELDYFVADGGSTDDSVAILESFGTRVRWRSGPDGGQAAAIADAWRRATDADVVAWLNSDDTWLPGAVRKAVAFLLEHPECAMVYGDADYTDRDGDRTGAYPTRPFDAERLRRECFVCQPATFVRREVLQVVDLPDPSLRYAMDYDLWIRIARRFPIGYLPERLATSRMYDENKTLGERDGVYREIQAVQRRHYGRVAASWRRGYALWRAKRLVERFLGFLPPAAHRGLYALGLKLSRRRADARPPYGDRWIADRAALTVSPDGEGWLHVVGESPVWPLRRPLRVRVEHEGRVVHTQQVDGRGRFTLDVRVPTRRAVPARLLVRANRTFVPAAHGISDDARSISFRIVECGPGRGSAPRAG